MKKYLIALAASVAFTATALAADLPNRKYVISEPVMPAYNPFYIGLNAGYNWDVEDGTVGGVAGYEFHKYGRVEATYDHYFASPRAATADTLTGNLILQYPVGFGFTPYALGGVGYRWDAIDSGTIYNLGVGLRYALTERVELDGRYRYVSDFDNRRSDNIVTVGMNVKF